jgi:hypothetical protein
MVPDEFELAGARAQTGEEERFKDLGRLLNQDSKWTSCPENDNYKSFTITN